MDMKDHVVIIGWDAFSKRITWELLNAKREVAVITRKDLETIQEEFHDQPVRAIQRNLTSYDSFSDVNIDESDSVFVNLEKDEDSLIAVLNMKKLYEDLEYAVILGNDDLLETFKSAGVSYVVSKSTITARIVTSYIYEEDVAEAESDFLAATETEEDYDIQQYLVTEDNPYAGKPYGDAFWDLKNRHNIVPLGLSKPGDSGEGERVLHKIPDDDLRVEPGDYFVVALQGKNEQHMEDIFGVMEGVFRADRGQ